MQGSKGIEFANKRSVEFVHGDRSITYMSQRAVSEQLALWFDAQHTRTITPVVHL
ncbi:protein of unknown function [Methylorubrum extorquens DM4]|uniref:Uncharacterized protein n=1 Tax=Methylorubrum extorquens (strain DSM 6343 / CIP 106787 / DM4) TaxID=661410 RepID=C7CCF8_METED|nr:protein of unknown function [Methylorubrum extorquens DM4]